MIKAMGLITKKIYAEGETKAEILQQLNQAFPSFEVNKNDEKGREYTKKEILPEPMKIF